MVLICSNLCWLAGGSVGRLYGGPDCVQWWAPYLLKQDNISKKKKQMNKNNMEKKKNCFNNEAVLNLTASIKSI